MDIAELGVCLNTDAVMQVLGVEHPEPDKEHNVHPEWIVPFIRTEAITVEW